MVGGVTHDLKLDLLVTFDALLNEHLMDGGEFKSVDTDLHKLGFIVGKATSGTAQGKGGTEHHGITDALGCSLGLLQIVGDLGGDDRLTDGLTQLLEQLSVLGALDGFTGCTQKLGMALLENALLLQLHGQIQTRLTADTGHDGVGALIAKDLRHVFQRQGLHIHLVGDGSVGHDGSGVGVHQHHLIALFLESKASLGARVVELGSLTDDDGARADDQNLFEVCSFCHCFFLRMYI